MFENEFYISSLIAAHFRGQLNDDQQRQLDLWLEKSEGNRTYFNQLSDDQTLQEKLKKYDARDKARLWEMTVRKLGDPNKNTPAVFTVRLWHKIAVAVSIILVAGTVLILNHYKDEDHYHDLNVKNDLPAGGNKAYITFGNGKTIKLSSQKNGVVINANALTYNDGTAIAARATGSISVATPMGGTYQVMLPDGTKCWLNAASTVQFPSTFSNSAQRKVILNGEAYFEVTKDKQHPFIVTTGGQEVKVMGTHFNISSYMGEPTRTTLLEGSVQINNRTLIKPGEQATGAGLDITVSQADIQADIAWKNGDFIFTDEPLENIMRMVSRWYNVDIIYTSESPKNLTMSGVVSRSRPISAVLERIQGTGKVSFKIDGRHIYVLP